MLLKASALRVSDVYVVSSLPLALTSFTESVQEPNYSFAEFVQIMKRYRECEAKDLRARAGFTVEEAAHFRDEFNTLDKDKKSGKLCLFRHTFGTIVPGITGSSIGSN